MTSTVDDAPATAITTLRLWVPGRPAPQGSKKQGAHGQMREASVYLPAWRQAVKKAVYERYREMGIDPAAATAAGWTLFSGPVGVRITFCVPWEPTNKPDGDKLERAVWDALSQSRVWVDDSYVTEWAGSKRRPVDDESTGAWVRVWQVTP